MNIRFYNARILTMADGCRMETGEVWVEGNRISYAGPSRPAGCCPAMPEGQKQEKKWDREIDAEGNVLMPGFKNAHTHSAMTFLRSYADDMPLLDWLKRLGTAADFFFQIERMVSFCLQIGH